ncbi:MAG: helix-turn-helix domain-containing protein [Lachnospiraceae bacterium]|uniref:helix-turn-helix domain-containing protein n=1 Tax=unclassified Blautia TaxID=2648079 RepID=UPI0025B95542|nr:helix-turn-helix domain-containing protein [Blautia sp.]MCI7112470.1 helix-turn-helix domain-containing protein [Lachnobacterium sp.]MDD6580608.1 helix-turn-helix domain-containing protein [Lachnospiraceae bacterium]MCI7449956.1 helix-turn-helix domain-containing protein [Blautia sp.]MDD6414386.1 helix-turn-helix domain-containing protein [Blautia sp.]MDY4117603.1 helix-turn-helix domain-containing protein [Blautia sp.]
MKIVIINGDEKVIDVACAAGFTSLSAFNRFFKKQMGQTPSEYRKNQSKPSIN